MAFRTVVEVSRAVKMITMRVTHQATHCQLKICVRAEKETHSQDMPKKRAKKMFVFFINILEFSDDLH